MLQLTWLFFAVFALAWTYSFSSFSFNNNNGILFTLKTVMILKSWNSKELLKHRDLIGDGLTIRNQILPHNRIVSKSSFQETTCDLMSIFSNIKSA